MICFHLQGLAPVCLKGLGKGTVEYFTSHLETLLLLQFGFTEKNFKSCKIMPFILILIDVLPTDICGLLISCAP